MFASTPVSHVRDGAILRQGACNPVKDGVQNVKDGLPTVKDGVRNVKDGRTLGVVLP